MLPTNKQLNAGLFDLHWTEAIFISEEPSNIFHLLISSLITFPEAKAIELSLC